MLPKRTRRTEVQPCTACCVSVRRSARDQPPEHHLARRDGFGYRLLAISPELEAMHRARRVPCQTLTHIDVQ